MKNAMPAFLIVCAMAAVALAQMAPTSAPVDARAGYSLSAADSGELAFCPGRRGARLVLINPE